MRKRELIIAGLAGVSAVAALTSRTEAAEEAETPAQAELRAVLKAHDDAMSNKDFAGVLATLAANASIMGTGPGEFWSGPDEIKTAYDHFFEGYDKGQQKSDYQFLVGDIGTDRGWLMASGNITMTKDGNSTTFPLNVSLVVTRIGGQWKITAMHYSTLTTA